MATGDSDSMSEEEENNPDRGDRWMTNILMEEKGESQEDSVINVAETIHSEIKIMEEDMIAGPTKRGREEDEEGSWNKVEKVKGKKHKQFRKEVFIWSREKLPKQFAIAKLFNNSGLTDVINIRYLNPYKLKIEVSTEECAGKLLDCQEFQTKGWKIYSAMDVNISYGIIRDVDLELSDEEALKAIKCPNDIEIISLKRLQRRDGDTWVPSEVAKVGFKGSYLPSYIYVDCLRAKVEPYVFPVTQCSNCWKFGHVKIRCSSKKIVCPKCTGEHDNCEVTTFTCVNCRGDHMALNRSCPVYAREKRVRELMAEYNCTYQVACNMYVRPRLPINSQTVKETEKPKINTNNSFSGLLLAESESNYKYTPNAFPPLFTQSRSKSPPEEILMDITQTGHTNVIAGVYRFMMQRMNGITCPLILEITLDLN
ncbi:hypothetical protein HW555_004177 [Spodoptera exigua]|uniref:Uncharacterized protein n=1 Tax=Spodoptera exigua TaxID=7107 RepID=A0A835LCI6_SPOEX|nr:hypothetical protein HW555_004177 [Spodoptera exigua]